MDRGEAGVAGAGTVAADVFEIREELADAGSVQVADVQRGRRLPGLGLNVGEQEPERVLVGGDRVTAGGAG